MAPNVLFSFGPDDSFFFYCPNATIQNCSSAFSVTVSPRLGRPYHVSLGPGENEYCAFYENQKSQLCYSINFPHSSFLSSVQSSLPRVFKANPLALQSSWLAVGPNGSFVVATPGNIDTSFNLSRNLENSLGNKLVPDQFGAPDKKKSKFPVQISLGLDNLWWVKWPDESYDWAFGNEDAYKGLQSIIGANSRQGKAKGHSVITHLALSPYSLQHWFLVLDGRQIEYALPRATVDQITPAILEFQASQATVSTVDIEDSQKQDSTSHRHFDVFQNNPGIGTDGNGYEDRTAPPNYTDVVGESLQAEKYTSKSKWSNRKRSCNVM